MKAATIKTRKERAVHSAQEKAQAVLAWWTERRRPSQICRELGITATVLSHWQERAMEGMLAALEPRKGVSAEAKPMLPPKVERLLVRKASQEPLTRLARRLTTLQQAKGPEKGPPMAEAKG